MKKIIYSALFAASLFIVSCGNDDSSKEESSDEKKTEEAKDDSSKEESSDENKTEKAKFDKSSKEYQMAEILCGCFETFNEDDSMGQMEAVGCMLEKLEGNEELNDADEEGTIAILNEICPETAKKFQTWMDNMDNN